MEAAYSEIARTNLTSFARNALMVINLMLIGIVRLIAYKSIQWLANVRDVRLAKEYRMGYVWLMWTIVKGDWKMEPVNSASNNII